MQDITDESVVSELLQKEGTVFFFYTPFCQTCKIAERMLQIVSSSKGVESHIYSCNLNYFPWVAEALKIQSVPALTVIRDNGGNNTLFAFESVVTVDAFLSKNKFF
ncbi:thioredoxin family protein [Alkalihalobacillus hwajinpoensis]|uniref:thioredoxin family protein n=1 Tax=Guptibacillus hwajinpoensis TaxID=208199 RepID=UPI0018844A25|nr:thioredoxin family protein [Pseudalkalibacillus hwajinpoensis]MBF0705884.1 thioredoxin family protein [Pseudalkalibacillus hwajinpoensis]